MIAFYKKYVDHNKKTLEYEFRLWYNKFEDIKIKPTAAIDTLIFCDPIIEVNLKKHNFIEVCKLSVFFVIINETLCVSGRYQVWWKSIKLFFVVCKDESGEYEESDYGNGRD